MLLLLTLAPLALLFQTALLLPFGEVFASVGAMSAAVIVISEAIEKIGWKLQGLASNLRALAVGIALGAIGAGFGLGMFADPAVLGDAGPLSAWYIGGPLVGIMAGLVGNLLFLLPVVKTVLELLKLRPKP
jgi:hypothetical protein